MKIKNSLFNIHLIITLFLFGCKNQNSEKTLTNNFNSFGQKFTTQNLTSELPQEIPKEKNITLKGKINKVCQNKGCWMEIVDSKNNAARVTFKDYSFFVPMDSMNKEVIIQGQLDFIQRDKGFIEHLESEGGTVKGIKNDKGILERSIIANGVLIKKT